MALRVIIPEEMESQAFRIKEMELRIPCCLGMQY